MDAIKNLLAEGKIWPAIARLRDELAKCRPQNNQWENALSQLKNDAAFANVVYKCPYTSRAKTKPRGYAGDAAMMDFIYGKYSPDLLSNLDATGEEIFRFTTNSAAARAVRHRRRLIADLIDETCTKVSADILSVACGHLREAEISKGIRNREHHSFVALDQDIESLNVVNLEYSQYGITTKNAGVASIVKGSANLGYFDFIYSAGLYDYLNDKVATKLTTNLVKHLKENGKILLANFLPNHEDIGYMEGIMDWNLIYRTPEQIGNLLDLAGCKNISTFVDPTCSIVYAIGDR